MYIYDYSKLKGRIVEKEGTLSAFIEKIKMSEPSFYSKINNKTEFKQSEILDSCNILGIPLEDAKYYFFCINELSKLNNNERGE